MIEKKAERWNWTPAKRKDRYVVVNRDTGEIVNDANGYGFKNEEKCWSWIKMMQRQVGIDTTTAFRSRDKEVPVWSEEDERQLTQTIDDLMFLLNKWKNYRAAANSCQPSVNGMR
jgi:hypothetical protein